MTPNRVFCTESEITPSWVTDITYIRTHEGWLYLAVVVDLFSRQVVGWSMGSRIDTSLVLDALLMALWRRQPRAPVIVHSDQGCQFTGHEWQTFLRDHNLVWCLKSNHQIMVLAARATDAKMVSALLCHTNGLGSSL